MRRRNVLLLALAVMIMVASAQVTPVHAAPIGPDPTWNTVLNGDFEQGTYALSGGIGNCPNSWTQTNSYYDPSYRLTPHYDVTYETTHGNNHASPTDDDYRLEITASCTGDFWNNAWVEEDVYQDTGDHLITPTTVFYGSIMLVNNYIDSEATSGAYRVKIYCHDDWNGYGTWVYLDYRLRETSGEYNYGEARDHKIIDLIMSVGGWEGVSDYPTGYTGRNLYQDVHNKFDSEGFSNYYYCRIYCVVWAKCVWLAGSTGTYAFDGVRIGEYPTVVASSASPTETDCGSVDFSWTCDTPTCMFQNGYDGNYGALRGGVSSYRVYIDASHYASTASTSTTYDFVGISKGRYTPYVIAQRVDNSQWGPSSSFSEVLNGYTLTVNTHWCASATGTATLTYVQHGTTKYHDLTDTGTSWSVIVDPSSTASVPTDASYSAGNYRVHTYDTRSWTISSSCTKEVYYYKQYWSSIATSGLISSYPATVSVVQGGTTNNPTTYGTWSDWADYNSNLKINSTVNVSGTRRYHTPNTVSWIVNSYPFSKSVTYYCQWKPTVSLVNTDIFHSVSVNYTQDGVPQADSGCYSSWSKWVDNNTVLSFSQETTGGFTTERWRTYGTRSWTVTSAITPTITYTHQYKCTISTGGLISSYPAMISVVQGGTTYNPTTYGTWSDWADYNSNLKINSTVIVTLNQERYHTPNTVSWTVTSALTPSMQYYHQWKPTVTLSGTSSSHKVNATYTLDGSAAIDLNAYASWSNWVDNVASLAFSQTTTGSGATERWHTPTVSLTITDASGKSLTYFHEWKPTVTLYGLPNPSHSVNATYTQDGSQASWNGYTGSWSDWVDDKTTLTFSLNSALSTSTERWHTYSTRSWTVSFAFSGSVTYIHQYYVSLNLLDASGNPLARSVSFQYMGDDGSGSANGTYTTTFSALWSRWMNAGSTLRNAKLASGSSQTDQWYSYDGPLNGDWRERTVSLSTTYTLTFYHQFRPEIELYTTQYGQKVYDNSWYLSPYDWIQASAYLTASDTHPPIVGTYTFTFTDPSGAAHPIDGSFTGSCFYQIPQARGAWTLCVTWDDGNGVVFNKTVPFYVSDYDVGFQSLVRSGNNLNITVYVNQLSGATSTIQDYGYVVAVTGGLGSGIYTNTTWFTFANGFMSVGVSSVSTKFFFPAGMWAWKAHMINLDPYLAHVVGVRILVVDPITGYIYANTTITKSLSIGGEGDLQIQFTANPNWHKHGLFRIYYTFLLYDVSGHTLLASKTVDYRNSSPLSWIMSGTGEGEIKAVYYFTGLHNSTTLTQVPVSLLAPYDTARFYLAFEDSHALSTQSQVSPAVMHHMNITFTGGNVFATGCVPPSTWVAEGNVTLSVDSPFYPKPPYYSNTTRFIFLGWKWTYASSQRWVSCDTTMITIQVTEPVQVVALWRTQFLVEFTPYVPTTAPTDTVQVSYTANKTLVNRDVKSAETIRVWVDANTLFTMHELWVNDYTWYRAHYDTPYENVTGGTSLTLDYVRTTNTVTNLNAQSNNFEAGDTLSLNLTLTTTYFNAQWVNVTVMVASKNAILVDANGLTWSNVKIQLQNNTAQITIPLPEDIGNGTLTVTLTPYGKVEPTTKQIILASSTIPPQGGGTNGGAGANFGPAIAITGITFTAVLAASVSIRAVAKRRRRERDSHTEVQAETREGEAPASVAPMASTVMRRGSRVAELQLLSLVKAVALMELDVEKGVQLRILQDGDSRFIRFLKRDLTRCGDYFDTAAKSYPGTLSITKWGDHITFIPYRKHGGNGRGRNMKSILIVSTTRELQNSEVEDLKKNMLTKTSSSNSNRVGHRLSSTNMEL